MSTDAQINANRLNAQKSTGPKSPEGKARSSLNALKSGIDAECNIIPGEDPAELAALTAQFLDHFQPADPNQLSLVDALIFAEWTQRRLRRVEAELWRSHVEHHVEHTDDGAHKIPLAATPTSASSIPSPALSAASTPPTACTSALSKPSRISSPPPPRPFPCQLNTLPHKLASFRKMLLNPPNRPIRPQ